jgi:hypothetical protein
MSSFFNSTMSGWPFVESIGLPHVVVSGKMLQYSYLGKELRQ